MLVEHSALWRHVRDTLQGMYGLWENACGDPLYVDGSWDGSSYTKPILGSPEAVYMMAQWSFDTVQEP